MALNDGGDNRERGASITTHTRACTVHAFCDLGVNNKSKVILESRDGAPRASLYRIRVPLRSHHHMRPRSPAPIAFTVAGVFVCAFGVGSTQCLSRGFDASAKLFFCAGQCHCRVDACTCGTFARSACTLGWRSRDYRLCVFLNIGDWHRADLQQLVLFFTAHLFL